MSNPWTIEAERLEFEERIAFGALRVVVRSLLDNYGNETTRDVLRGVLAFKLTESDIATANIRNHLKQNLSTQSDSLGGMNADAENVHRLRQGPTDG